MIPMIMATTSFTVTISWMAVAIGYIAILITLLTILIYALWKQMEK